MMIKVSCLYFLTLVLAFSCGNSIEISDDISADSNENDMIGFFQKENSDEIIDIYSGKLAVCNGTSQYYSDQEIIWENENLGRYSISSNDLTQWYQLNLSSGQLIISTINADYSNIANAAKYKSISQFACRE